MGNFSSSNNNQSYQSSNFSSKIIAETSDFIVPKRSPPRTQPTTNQATVMKSAEEKCNEIGSELENLEKDVNNFKELKTDKSYLKLDELLTRCLLKLDALERDDEKVNQLRRKLINYANQLSDRLETIASNNGNNNNSAALVPFTPDQQQQQQQQQQIAATTTTDSQQPPLKRIKSSSSSSESTKSSNNNNN